MPDANSPGIFGYVRETRNQTKEINADEERTG